MQSLTFNLQFRHTTRLIPPGLLPMLHVGHQREPELESMCHWQSDRKALQSRRGNNLEELNQALASCVENIAHNLKTVSIFTSQRCSCHLDSSNVRLVYLRLLQWLHGSIGTPWWKFSHASVLQPFYHSDAYTLWHGKFSCKLTNIQNEEHDDMMDWETWRTWRLPCSLPAHRLGPVPWMRPCLAGRPQAKPASSNNSTWIEFGSNYSVYLYHT